MASAYSITICSHGRALFFSTIDPSGHITLTDIGKIIDEEWNRIAEVRPNVVVDEYIIMPNHIHGILIITDGPEDSSPRTFGGSIADTISSIISQTKSAVTKRVWKTLDPKRRPIWQSRFHDRILRDERELEMTRLYIRNNPLQWADDVENPEVARRLIRVKRL